MRIAIDTKPLLTGHAIRGIGSYVRNLTRELAKLKKVESVESKNAELIHYPYFDLFSHTLKIRDKPVVVTIYDVIPLLYPKYYPTGIKGKFNFFLQKRELKKVTAIITISENSKKDIVKYLRVDPDKVSTIHLAASDIFKPITNHQALVTAQKKYNLPKTFVLYVGDVNYNKNLGALATACRQISVPLVIVGKQASSSDFDVKHVENQPFVKFLQQFGDDSNVLRLGYVPDTGVFIRRFWPADLGSTILWNTGSCNKNTSAPRDSKRLCFFCRDRYKKYYSWHRGGIG